MTRAWGSVTKSPMGAVLRSPHYARGPSRVFEAPNVIGAHDLSGTSWYEGSGSHEETLQDYLCAASGSPPTTDTPTGYFTINDIDPDLRGGDVVATTTLYSDKHKGFYFWYSSTGDLRPLTSYGPGIPSPSAPGTVRVLDTVDPALYWYARCITIPEANRISLPSCATTWWPSTPPSDLTIQDAGVDGTTGGPGYVIFKRTAVGEDWARVWDAPYDDPGYLATYVKLQISQSTEQLVAQSSTTEIEAWPIETGYSAATPTTLTLSASTINWYACWGLNCVVARNDGQFETFNLNTGSSLGTLPAPHDTAAWNYGEVAFGWLATTDTNTGVQFWRLDDTATAAPTHYQTVTDSTLVTVSMVAEDWAVSGTWTRLYLDHTDSVWRMGGDMPHAQELFDAGARWNGTIYRHIVMTGVPGYTNAGLVQVF